MFSEAIFILFWLIFIPCVLELKMQRRAIIIVFLLGLILHVTDTKPAPGRKNNRRLSNTLQSFNIRRHMSRGTAAGCYYLGELYPANHVISEYNGVYWCFGVYCNANGQVVYWSDSECFPTTSPPPPTTEPPSTTTPTPPPSTTPFGCFYNGEYFPPGREISRGQDRGSNWCFGMYCGEDGQILAWDNFQCFPTTTTTPTPPPPPPITTMPSRRRLRYLDSLRRFLRNNF